MAYPSFGKFLESQRNTYTICISLETIRPNQTELISAADMAFSQPTVHCLNILTRIKKHLCLIICLSYHPAQYSIQYKVFYKDALLNAMLKCFKRCSNLSGPLLRSRGPFSNTNFNSKKNNSLRKARTFYNLHKDLNFFIFVFIF